MHSFPLLGRIDGETIGRLEAETNVKLGFTPMIFLWELSGDTKTLKFFSSKYPSSNNAV